MMKISLINIQTFKVIKFNHKAMTWKVEEHKVKEHNQRRSHKVINLINKVKTCQSMENQAFWIKINLYFLKKPLKDKRVNTKKKMNNIKFLKVKLIVKNTISNRVEVPIISLIKIQMRKLIVKEKIKRKAKYRKVKKKMKQE